MIKSLINYLRNSNNKNQFNLVRVLVIIGVITLVIIGNNFWNSRQRENQKFLKSIDLQLTMIVTQILPTGNHGYGVVFGKMIRSNKPSDYLAANHKRYVFCKIKGNKTLLISDFYVFRKNDSVIVDSKLSKYWVYRNKKLISEYNLTSTTDDFLYSDLEKVNYLNFNIYK